MDVKFLLTAILFVAMVNNWVESLPEKRQAPLEPFTFDDIYNSQYRTRRPDTRWIDGEDAYTYRDPETGELFKVYANTTIPISLIDNSTFTKLQTGTYFVSPDVKFVLFAYDITSIWRSSFTAKYQIQDIETKAVTNVSGENVLQYAGWSASGHSLSFVMNNNLYYQLTPSDTHVQLTNDGDPLYLFNGVPDWLYEEEILGDRVAHYWSPTGEYICYAQFNDTGVPLQDWAYYGPTTDVYGQTRHVAYPKAGRVLENGQQGENTRVKLFVTNITSPTPITVELLAPVSELTNDHYYVQVAWLDSDRVYVTWTNRVQNHSISIIYNVTDMSSGSLTGVQNLKYNVTNGWLEVPPPAPWILEDGQKYLTILSNDDWRHLALVTSASDATGVADTTKTFLTNNAVATHEVMSVVGYNAELHLVFFIATNNDPTERHLFSVDITNTNSPILACLTCDVDGRLPSYLSTYRYFSASFGATGLYYILSSLGPDVPIYVLMSRTMVQHEHDVKVLENNSVLKQVLSLKAMPTREFLDIQIPETPYTTKAEVFFPPGYDPSSGTKYRFLIYVYAGPGSQRVVKTFPYVGGTTTNWLTYLKSFHHIVVASIDNRGSMAQGDKFKFEMYRKLGTVEVQDQIYLGQYAKGNMPYVDQMKKVAMFGWSYGGGTTAHAIGDPTQTIKCGISVAPVTTMRYYDTAYTERYLGLATPADDELGYNNTDVMKKVANFDGKQFLIAHGIADDNVHFMHSTQLVRALANEGIQFRQYAYADQNHGISSYGQSRHLFNSLTNFLLNDCWPEPAAAPTGTPCTGHALPATSVNIALMCLSFFVVAMLKMHV